MPYPDHTPGPVSQHGINSPAIRRIARERERHAALGYTGRHDAEHLNGELLAAAMCYIVTADPVNLDPAGDFCMAMWPWGLDQFKPCDDPARNLEKAGALLAAALDQELDPHAAAR